MILFDFFGTLVDYSPSRTEQGYPRTHALLAELGATCSYDAFLARWVTLCAAFDARSDADDSEYSMAEVATALLAELGLDRAAAPELAATYVDEWQAGVSFLPGVAELLHALKRRRPLAVVSNTHSPTMVPDLLDRMGVAAAFEAVILSVDLGRRKPHPSVYAAALAGRPAADALFVGDTYAADYAGPVAAGMRALLIDPAGTSPAPPADRIGGVLEVAGRL